MPTQLDLALRVPARSCCKPAGWTPPGPRFLLSQKTPPTALWSPCSLCFPIAVGACHGARLSPPPLWPLCAPEGSHISPIQWVSQLNADRCSTPPSLTMQGSIDLKPPLVLFPAGINGGELFSAACVQPEHALRARSRVLQPPFLRTSGHLAFVIAKLLPQLQGRR